MAIYEKMNEYLSNLAVLNVKLHNLHWNVVGLQFVEITNLLNQYMTIYLKNMMLLQN